MVFGSWVLLQPERINAYAPAVIRTLQPDEHQRGCLMEERVLKGDLAYESSMAQAFPVLLVIRNSEGEVRWMEVRDWLKRESEAGAKPVKHIVFEGERFDVMSVRRWRERVLLERTSK